MPGSWYSQAMESVTCCKKKDHPILRFEPRFNVSNLV